MSVLVVIPTFNEEKTILNVLKEIEVSSVGLKVTVVVSDGQSEDDTQQIVKNYSPEHYELVLMENPKRVQASGVNAAVKKYGNDYDILVRMDAHSIYPDSFLYDVIKPIEDGVCDSVVVSMNTLGGNCIQNIQSDLFNSPIGNGGSLHRRKNVESRFVEHGHHAAISMRGFIEAGMYNESLVANEDAEFDRRFILSGRKIYLNSNAVVGYLPRSTFTGLVKQYFRNGYYRHYSSTIDGSRISYRQMLPVLLVPVFLLSIISLFLFAFGWERLGLMSVSPICAYLLILFVGGAIFLRKEPVYKLPVFVMVAIAVHLSFGAGFIFSNFNELK